MKSIAAAFSLGLGTALLVPSISIAAPRCTGLAERVLHRMGVLAATSEITPATETTPAYCQVNLTRKPAINIRVGLPLSERDGGTGGVQGAWNGRVKNLGGGGFAGTVGSVAGPVVDGYVASSTDTGHSVAWCNAVNPKTGLPNAQPDCGTGGGGFVLDPENNLIRWQIRDFMTDSLYQQVRWALRLARMYYGQKPERNYWSGCSTGGRQGFEMAMRHANLFDGFLVGAPAMNWNRFQIGEMWPAVVAMDIVGPAGIPPAKSDAANAAARAACDANDGVVDGMINEPRRCAYNATALVCTGNPDDPATCLTPEEAEAVNRIWDGPRNRRGQRLWGGIPRGTTFSLLLFGGNAPFPFIDAYVRYWMHQNPDFDWRQITIPNFSWEFELSDRKFRRAETDDPNLDTVRARGAKIIHYHGINDPLIVAFGSYNYVSNVFARYGVRETQSFMRSFFYPGNGHCGGGPPGTPLISERDLFQALVDWVENGEAPNHVVAQSADGTRSRKICKYPDEAMYIGSSSTDDHRSFLCLRKTTEPLDLAADSLTARRYREAP